MSETNIIDQNNSMNLDDFIESTNLLISLLRQENNYLSALKISEIETLQPKKSDLIDFLSNCQKSLKQNPELTNNFDRKKIEQSKILQDELKIQMEENLKRLSVSIEVNHKILDCLKDAFIKESKKQSGYNSGGSYGNRFKSTSELPAFSLQNYI
jgi:hypothetical protein